MAKTISMSELTKHADRIAEDIERRKIVYRIKRPGASPMLLMAWAEYESWKATVELLQHPDWHQIWAQSEREVAEGRYRELEVVLAEIDRDRAAHRNGRAAVPRVAKRGGEKGARSAANARGRTTKRHAGPR